MTDKLKTLKDMAKITKDGFVYMPRIRENAIRWVKVLRKAQENGHAFCVFCKKEITFPEEAGCFGKKHLILTKEGGRDDWVDGRIIVADWIRFQNNLTEADLDD